MTSTLITPEFEKALRLACVQRATRYALMDPAFNPFAHGDQHAVRYGAFLSEIAKAAGVSVSMARRRMRELQKQGRVLRDDCAGGRTSWWIVGLAAELRPESVAAAPPPAPPAGAQRQTLTPPAAVPVRQHWSDVLGVARDCSTSEARDAFRERLAAVPEHDLDAEQQRQRIREAYSQRLSEDGISEYE